MPADGNASDADKDSSNLLREEHHCLRDDVAFKGELGVTAGSKQAECRSLPHVDSAQRSLCFVFQVAGIVLRGKVDLPSRTGLPFRKTEKLSFRILRARLMMIRSLRVSRWKSRRRDNHPNRRRDRSCPVAKVKLLDSAQLRCALEKLCCGATAWPPKFALRTSGRRPSIRISVKCVAEASRRPTL